MAKKVVEQTVEKKIFTTMVETIFIEDGQKTVARDYVPNGEKEKLEETINRHQRGKVDTEPYVRPAHTTIRKGNAEHSTGYKYDRPNPRQEEDWPYII